MTDMEGAVRGRTREAQRDGFMGSAGSACARWARRATSEPAGGPWESTPSSGSERGSPRKRSATCCVWQSSIPSWRPRASGGIGSPWIRATRSIWSSGRGDPGVPQANCRARLADRSPSAAGRRRRGDRSVRGGRSGLHRGPRGFAAPRDTSLAHRSVRSPRPSRGGRGLYLPADFAPVLLLPSEIDPLEHEPLGSAPRLAEECRRLAAAMDLPRGVDPDGDEIRAARDEPRGGAASAPRASRCSDSSMRRPSRPRPALR